VQGNLESRVKITKHLDEQNYKVARHLHIKKTLLRNKILGLGETLCVSTKISKKTTPLQLKQLYGTMTIW
jgi:hypothetical protein